MTHSGHQSRPGPLRGVAVTFPGGSSKEAVVLQFPFVAVRMQWVRRGSLWAGKESN